MTRFDYESVDWRFVSRILDENSRRLSRTRAGRIDLSTSDKKQGLPIEKQALIDRSAANEQRVHQFLFDARTDPPPRDGGDVLRLLWGVADRTNDGLLPTANKFREWEIRQGPAGGSASGPAPTDPGSAAAPGSAVALAMKVPYRDLPAALDRFAETVSNRWPELAADPVPLASWAEWELNGGSLHPFYDGCGRISRSFAALLLVRAGSLPPLYDTFESYFAHGNRGEAAFADYMRERIEACAEWLERPATR